MEKLGISVEPVEINVIESQRTFCAWGFKCGTLFRFSQS